MCVENVPQMGLFCDPGRELVLQSFPLRSVALITILRPTSVEASLDAAQSALEEVLPKVKSVSCRQKQRDQTWWDSGLGLDPRPHRGDPVRFVGRPFKGGQNHSRNSPWLVKGITWLPGIEKGDFGGVFGIISKASIKDELKRLRLKTRGNLNTTQLLVKYCKGRFFFLYPYPNTSK